MIWYRRAILILGRASKEILKHSVSHVAEWYRTRWWIYPGCRPCIESLLGTAANRMVG